MNPLSLKTLRLLKPALAAAVMVALAGSPAFADGRGHGNPNPGILPPSSKPFRMSYGDWSDAWVRWAYSIPADQNPIADLTGQYAAVGQSGEVWFLAGTFGGTANRTITVPEGKALFFPIGEWAWVNTPQYGDNPWSPQQEAYARSVVAAGVDDFVNLSCQIDDREVADLTAYRFQTPPGHAYMVTFPENNVWGIAAGTYGPSVDDGYWLMLAPLSHGHHTIHFTAGSSSNPDFNLDVTYNITVGRSGQGNLGNPGILPPQSHAFGKSYAEWAAAWWQWGLTLPLEGHPFYGCPADCEAGQSGPVWFVAGGPTECSCAVPAGKAVFFPLVNAECSSLEDPPFHGNTATEERDCAKYWADHIVVGSLFCEIDGVPVKNLASYRFVSPQISFTAPTPWVYGAVGGPGTSVGDGYYLLLHPLSKGVHTIHFGGASHFDAGELGPDPVDFGIDTTYHLLVTPNL